MKIQIGLMVSHLMLVKWPVCRSVVVPSVVLPSTGIWESGGTAPFTLDRGTRWMCLGFAGIQLKAGWVGPSNSLMDSEMRKILPYS
jgi:hypothetical protein